MMEQMPKSLDRQLADERAPPDDAGGRARRSCIRLSELGDHDCRRPCRTLRPSDFHPPLRISWVAELSSGVA